MVSITIARSITSLLQSASAAASRFMRIGTAGRPAAARPGSAGLVASSMPVRRTRRTRRGAAVRVNERADFHCSHVSVLKAYAPLSQLMEADLQRNVENLEDLFGIGMKRGHMKVQIVAMGNATF